MSDIEMKKSNVDDGNDKEVSSPCIDTCCIDPDTGLCTGCYRTGNEIAAWRSLSTAEKETVLDDLPKRKTTQDTE